MQKIAQLSLLAFLTASPVVLRAADAPAASSSDDLSRRTREFVIMGYEGIRAEMKDGAGAYLKTLMELLGARGERQVVITGEVRMLLARFPNIMDFADHVAALQTSGSDFAAVETVVAPPSGPGIFSGADLENALIHLTKGSPVTAYLRSGQRERGTFADYDARKLWIRGASRRSIPLEDILAVDVSRP